jgi:hypothetical protein
MNSNQVFCIIWECELDSSSLLLPLSCSSQRWPTLYGAPPFPSSHYQNGVDFHLDMAAAQFLSKQLLVGAVGYIYNQVTSDRGSAPILGSVQSRVAGAGPQIGYIFPINGMQGYLNFKSYFEFDRHDRADGWNTWLTFAISPPAPPAATPRASRTSMMRK